MTDSATDPIETVRAVGRRLSNWGRWGAEDERGTLNFLTPEAVRRGAACVRSGRVISLALPLDMHGPMEPAVHGRFNPIHKMTRYRGDSANGKFFPHHCSSDDMAVIALQSSTQWDALAHVWYDGKLYNGFDAETTLTAAGAERCSIANMREGVAGRAVLVDVPRFMGLEVLPDNFGVTPDLLDSVLAAQNVETASGDILLLRTGCVGQWQRTGIGLGNEQPGLAFACADWLHDHEISAVAADNIAVERLRPGPGEAIMGLHMVALRDMGMPFGELFVLDELAEDCARTGTWDLLLSAAPLYFPHAVGTPLNPLAIR